MILDVCISSMILVMTLINYYLSLCKLMVREFGHEPCSWIWKAWIVRLCVALGEHTGNLVRTVKIASYSLFKDNFLTNMIVNL